jgi:hypothetical protein
LDAISEGTKKSDINSRNKLPLFQEFSWTLEEKQTGGWRYEKENSHIKSWNLEARENKINVFP